jgi:pimeloyl-ACP methyl ester carboxylesterase
MSPDTKVSTIEADGIEVFYRTAGPADGPVVLLLHGFPSSSHMFRNLIPHLAAKGYHVIAPDFPGFGFTSVPEARKYVYSFASLAKTTEAFVDALHLTRFAIYIFDYGAPTGLRLALDRPESVAAIVTQNGNAYVEGFGHPFWDPIQKAWASGSQTDIDALASALTPDITAWQYTNGSPHPGAIPPESWTLDQALLERPGNTDAQLALFYDYRTNVDLYPAFHEYFRKSNVPVLAAWGKNDAIFVKEGVPPFEKDVKKLEVQWLDAGHFALETNEATMAGWMDRFFKKFGVFEK